MNAEELSKLVDRLVVVGVVEFSENVQRSLVATSSLKLVLEKEGTTIHPAEQFTYRNYQHLTRKEIPLFSIHTSHLSS